ncbi:hypothetical protein F5884DRAFT_842136 [Xylogone sp. PMI_703]|nr:hypothetical protein F5884DRAFT_842136 [Xylogone sp. PMI_703]
MATMKTIVLITGANSGIGFETSRILANASPNYHIIMTARSLEKGKQALSRIQSQTPPPKGTLSLLQLDVTDQGSISAAASAVEKEFGHLDVLINNAAIAVRDSTLKDRLEKTLATNTIGPALVSEAFIPLLQKSTSPRGPRLIYVTSGWGSITRLLEPTKGSGPTTNLDATPYRVSKAGLNMLAACHHVLYGGENGIKVWTFCPGYVVTSLGGGGETGYEAKRKDGALEPSTSAESLLAIIEGKRDADVGAFIHRDGRYPW